VPRPKRDGFSFNGVQLGLGSPLINAPPRRRYVGPSEFEIQAHAIDLVLGPLARDGPHVGKRVPGSGLTGRHPELALLYAVPNGGHRLKGAAAKAKAEGVLEGVPDLVLPVPRYPFHGLYVEVKRPGELPRECQRVILHELIAQGYCSLVAEGTQEIVDSLLGYVKLPPWPALAELLAARRSQLERLLPRPIPAPRHA
jgi:hypothetical protein